MSTFLTLFVHDRSCRLGIVAGVAILSLGLMRAPAQEPPTGVPGIRPRETTTASVAESRFAAFWDGVVLFRNRCVVEGTPGWKEYCTNEAFQRVEALGQKLWGEQLAEQGWSFYFNLALFDVGRPESSTPMVGFYHPWSDVWVLTQWRLDPKPQIVDVEVLLGDWVRNHGKPPFDARPDWLSRKGFLPEQLAQSVLNNFQEFRRAMHAGEPWWKSWQVAKQASLLADVNYPLAAVRLSTAFIRAQELTVGDPQQPRLQQLIAAERQFQEAGTQGKIDAQLAVAQQTEPKTSELIRGLPPAVFAHLIPVAWQADDGGAVAFLSPATNPDFCLIPTYVRDGDELRLQRVDLLYFPGVAAVAQRRETK